MIEINKGNFEGPSEKIKTRTCINFKRSVSEIKTIHIGY